MSVITVRQAQVEVRGRLATEFDEVFAENATVHLEKMTDQMFCLIVETATERAIFHIFTKNGRAHIDASTFDHEAAIQRAQGRV